MIRQIRDALGWLTGRSAGLIIAALAGAGARRAWIGIALGVRDAAVMHARITIWIAQVFESLNGLAPGVGLVRGDRMWVAGVSRCARTLVGAG